MFSIIKVKSPHYVIILFLLGFSSTLKYVLQHLFGFIKYFHCFPFFCQDFYSSILRVGELIVLNCFNKNIRVITYIMGNLELMQAYLDDLPCRLRTARDGLEAVAAIDQECPDLVLLDVMMPRMSGFEVCQKIKSSPQTRDVVVIMVTALHEVADFERAVECGTNDFITHRDLPRALLTDHLLSAGGLRQASPFRRSRGWPERA